LPEGHFLIIDNSSIYFLGTLWAQFGHMSIFSLQIVSVELMDLSLINMKRLLKIKYFIA